MRVYKNQIAMVTGAASGIGKALVEQLLDAGAATVIATDVNENGLKKLAAERAETDAELQIRHLDVRDADAVQALVDEVWEEFGPIDLMCNNAGINVTGEVRDIDMDVWNWTLDVNLRGVVHGVHAVYPKMVERGQGTILNTASGLGLMPTAGVVPYVASKHAVVGLSLGLRQEAIQHGVSVNVLCPGFVDTPILRSPSDHVEVDKLMQSIPFKYQKPDDCARAALKGAARDKGVITTPFYVRLLWWGYRLHPGGARIAARTNRRALMASRKRGS